MTGAFPIPRALVRAAWLLSIVSGLALLLTKEINATYALIFAALLLAAIKIDRFPSVSRFVKKCQPVLALIAFGIGVFDFVNLTQSFLLSIAHFLLVLQGLRLLTLRSVRDVLGAALLASMMMISASTLSVEWTFFLMLSLFLPAIIWLLISANVALQGQIIAASTKNLDPPVFRHIEAGLSDEGFLDDRSPVWVAISPVVRSSTAIAFLVTAFWCAAVFVFFPRISLRGFKGQFLQPVHRSGFTNQVNLDKEARIFKDESVVMRVEIQPQDRRRWPGYLRGAALDAFDGRVWTRRAHPPLSLAKASRGFNVMYERARSEILRQSIYLESMDSALLFAAPVPVSVSIERPLILLNEDGSFQRPGNDVWRTHYEVESLVDTEDASNLHGHRLFRGAVTEGDESMTSLPPGMPIDEIRALAYRVTIGALTDREKAQKVADYLSTTYQYTLDIKRSDSVDPINYFLFESKKGHCEFFASAMGVMMRSLGIPSRIATGFFSHEWNARGGYYIVRMRDAHAWVEIYDGRRWIQFDPTPRDFSNEPGATWTHRYREMMDYMNLRWNRYILSYDLQRQVSMIQTMGSRSRQLTLGMEGLDQKLTRLFTFRWFSGTSKDVEVPRDTRSGGILLILMGGGVIVAALLWRTRRYRNVVWFYPALQRALTLSGASASPGQTVLEMTRAVTSNAGPKEKDIQTLSDEYHRRRFGGLPELTDRDVRLILKRL